MNILTAELERKARQLKDDGLSYAEVAIMLGFSKSAIMRRLAIKDACHRGKCNNCGEFSQRLHAHHRNYTRDEYTMLCQRCHAKEHKDTASPVLRVRLKHAEMEKVIAIMNSNHTGCATASEFMRLLLAREWNRRHNLGKPKAIAWQSAARNGRPAKKTP
jgi:hypothetical protein